MRVANYEAMGSASAVLVNMLEDDSVKCSRYKAYQIKVRRAKKNGPLHRPSDMTI